MVAVTKRKRDGSHDEPEDLLEIPHKRQKKVHLGKSCLPFLSTSRH